ncbi:MAG: molybdenum cofactor guanylyltransferase [Sphingomonas sp.]|nr:molybdenum cofactor guanylyltransferase [Sphingomonas sp.]
MTPAVLILAGGESRRIGGGKPLRLLGGRTLLERAVALAQGWSDSVTVAARSAAQVGSLEIRLLLDPPGLEGPLGGLASALRLGRPLVLTIPCDMPFLPDDLPARLAAALPGHGAALAMSGGQVHPVCGLWRIDALAQLRGYAGSGRRSLIGLAETIGYVAVEWPGDPFFNVNSPEDLAEAERRLG